MMKTICAIILILIATPHLNAQELSMENEFHHLEEVELPTDLDRVLRDYEKGWREKDASYLAELFAEDGFILRPGQQPIRGRENIKEAYKGSGGPLFLHAFDYSVSDSIGYIIGGYKTAAENPDAGKFILTLRKVEDRWMITADMDNGNSR